MRKYLLLLVFISISFYSRAQNSYIPTAENLEARKWFDSARFGMFIHWGAFSVLGDGEWAMNVRNIHVDEYKRLLRIFNPIAFDAANWVSTAKNAGMQYITFVTRHHDGFSNWDTKQSDWKITNTLYHKDVLKQLADECHKQGIKLFVYYSLLDWSRSDYQYETGRTGKGTGRILKSDWNHYISFMKAQLSELLTNYGAIAGVWFDGHWDQLNSDRDSTPAKVNWHYDELYSLIHKLQPQCLIGNNHHLTPHPGEDFQMFEKDLPGNNNSSFSGASVSSLPLETCETINYSWGFNIADRNYKSVKQLIQYLIKDAAYGANFLLNIGPMPNGEIQPEFTERLQLIGTWLNKYGETIYGTTAGFIKPQEWGAVTEKKNKIYLHILNKTDDKLLIKIPYKIKSAQAYLNRRPITYRQTSDRSTVFDISSFNKDEIDNIIELQVQR